MINDGYSSNWLFLRDEKHSIFLSLTYNWMEANWSSKGLSAMYSPHPNLATISDCGGIEVNVRRWLNAAQCHSTCDMLCPIMRAHVWHTTASVSTAKQKDPVSNEVKLRWSSKLPNMDSTRIWGVVEVRPPISLPCVYPGHDITHSDSTWSPFFVRSIRPRE